ncbi:MAG: DUF3422 domain-containing protein [Oceanicaulis sp.]
MTMLTLPPDHKERIRLSAEVHARPPQPLAAPLIVSYLVLYTGPDASDSHLQAVTALAQLYKATPPTEGATHYTAHLDKVRVIWERHTEYCRYTFIRQDIDEHAPFESPPLADIPEDWRANLPGEVLYAAHVLMVHAPEEGPAIDDAVKRIFGGGELVGSKIAGGVALTSFRSYSDGFNRFLIRNRSMSPLQAGRQLQGLLEMDTYRMMALLALPVARELGKLLTEREQELAGITREMADGDHADESGLLDRITRLEADIERRHSQHYYRFSAASAYYGIVQARIRELREQRVENLQTFAEFIERRLAPAMNTVTAVAERLESMSKHLARATQLLSTRVALTQEQQSRKLLEAMARRAKLQLRLQQTVEGLSIAAITYYVVGLIGYAAEGGEVLGVPLDPKIIQAISIPFVVAGLAWSLARVRRALEKAEE